jgi:hypothetical protein
MALNATIDLTVKKPDFKSMKAEIKALTIEAQQAVMQFGEFSPEARKAEAALASARDRMDDFNDRVKAVNPDKFAQLQTVVSGVARGFQAAQGAMALFGNQSKDLEKTMVKLQGAMALADGLEGLGKVQQQFTAIAGNIKGGVINAFKALGNMSTLAFGAIGIALTLIIANFDTLKKAVMSLIPGLGKMADFIGGLVQQFTDFVGVTSAQDRALDKLNKTTAKSNEQLDREIALLKARGDEVGAFSKQREKLTNDLAQARANYGKNTEKEWGKIILDTKNALDILEVEEGKYITTQAQAQTDANKESEAKRKARIAKEIQDELDRQAKLEAARKQHLDQVISAELSANEAARQSRLAMATTDEERIQIGYENKLAALKEAQIQEEIAVAGNEEALALIRQKYKDLEIVATAEVDAEELALNKKKADEAVKIADEQAKSIADINAKAVADQLANEAALADAKDKMVQATRDAITALGGLFKEGSDAAKAAALVDIAIGTGVGFINALDIAQKGAKATGPAAPFAFPIFYASQIAAVLGAANKAKAILKSGKGGGAASAPSQMGGGGAPQMAAPKVSSTLPTVTGFDTKVFVTEGDIRRTSDRVDSTKKVSVVK